MNFHDSTKTFFFSKHQSKAKFKNLDDTEVLSSDFPDLRTSEASMTSTASTASAASMTSTASFYHFFIFNLMVGSSLAPKLPIPVSFCGMDHQKSNFSLISFLSEAVEASLNHLFGNWLMKLRLHNFRNTQIPSNIK